MVIPTEDCEVLSVRPLDGHVRLMQPVAHAASRDSLAVSTGALAVYSKYLRRIRNARLELVILHGWPYGSLFSPDAAAPREP